VPVANFGHPHVTKADGRSSSGWYHFKCGHCGNDVSGAVVAYAGNAGGGPTQWLLCPVCREGSVHTGSSRVYPGVAYGPDIDGLPADVKEAYTEARRCLSINADTPSEVMCRKILMHVAVDPGAKEGKTFAHYIDYLKDKGYVTPPMLGWVDLIRDTATSRIIGSHLQGADAQKAHSNSPPNSCDQSTRWSTWRKPLLPKYRSRAEAHRSCLTRACSRRAGWARGAARAADQPHTP
jgi:hypothetical protein